MLEDDLPAQLAAALGFHHGGARAVLAGRAALQRITARCPDSGMLEGTGELS